MILVIDDCPRRQSGFRRAFGSSCIAFAMDYLGGEQALTWRTPDPLTTIYLDHDGVDGERLARLMADQKLHTQARVVIHSSNYLGAVRMRDILQDTHDVELTSYDEICKDATP